MRRDKNHEFNNITYFKLTLLKLLLSILLYSRLCFKYIKKNSTDIFLVWCWITYIVFFVLFCQVWGHLQNTLQWTFTVLYMRFCILLFCWIVISCTFIPYLSIFNLSMHKIRCLVNFKTVSVSLLMLTVSIMYIFVILNELHPFVLYLYSQHKLLYTVLD